MSFVGAGFFSEFSTHASQNGRRRRDNVRGRAAAAEKGLAAVAKNFSQSDTHGVTIGTRRGHGGKPVGRLRR